MNVIGNFGEALLRAIGRDAATANTRLHASANAALCKHGMGTRAIDALRSDIEDDPALVVEMLRELKLLDPLIKTFLLRRASALRAEGVVVSAGHERPDAHHSSARRSPTDQPAGQIPVDAQHLSARRHDNERAGHYRLDTHYRDARARPAPGKPRGAAQMAGVSAVLRNHVLDRIMVNGQPLRSVTAGEALGAAEVMEGNAATIKRICTGLKPDVPVGQQVSDDEAASRAEVA